MKIRQEIKDRLPYFKETRRLIHMNPEIGYDTSQTMKTIIDKLKRFPANQDEVSGVFYLPGEKPYLAFRCELDGLLIQESNDCYYRSKNHAMHACGHDAHIAILIETMLYFMRHVHSQGLVFLFQPAEESGSGAQYMIDQGIFEKYEIGELYATHVFPSLGDIIGCKEGVFMASSNEIHITILGKGVHAAHYQEGINTLQAATFFLNEFYRLQHLMPQCILHIGKCESGEVGNAVASKTVLVGTMRFFDTESELFIKQSLIDLLKKIDEERLTKSTIQFTNHYDSVVNDSNLVNKIKHLIHEDYVELEAIALSEDFSFYSKKCKCCYYLCGLTSTVDLHENCFDLDEEECLKAIELNIRIVENFLCE